MRLITHNGRLKQAIYGIFLPFQPARRFSIFSNTGVNTSSREIWRDEYRNKEWHINRVPTHGTLFQFQFINLMKIFLYTGRQLDIWLQKRVGLYLCGPIFLTP
jgi:hypothetical protein